MDSFSLIVLEETLERAAQMMPSQRVEEDVKVIRGYISVIELEPGNREHIYKLRKGLSDLVGIAKQNQQFVIAARLESIARQLEALPAA
jgi:hypothetical protein